MAYWHEVYHIVEMKWANIIKGHIELLKHKAGKERLAQRKKGYSSIVDAIRKYDQEVYPVGKLMSNNQLAYI